MRKFLVLALLALLPLAATAQPVGPAPPAPGVFAMKKNGASLHLTVTGHSFTSKAALENYLAYRAAEATLDDLKFYRANFKRIIVMRESLARELTKLGFRVLPSQTNFILARPPLFPAKAWLEKLREQKILVRWFSAPEVSDYLRITIGTPAEAAALLKAVRKIAR
jgi:hypothetical protein